MTQPIIAPKSVRHVPIAEWRTEARALFGPNPAKWRFVCPRCGHVQSLESMHEHGTVVGKDNADDIYFNCEGRLNPGFGCDWTLGGLLNIHAFEVVVPDGSCQPVFDFDRSQTPAAIAARTAVKP